MPKYARRVVTVKNLYPGPKIGEQDKESPKSRAAVRFQPCLEILDLGGSDWQSQTYYL